MKKLDDEIEKYKQEIGVDKFREEYAYIYNLSDRIKKNELRYSRKRYGNSQQVLELIKDKYKNGVTEDILNEFYNKLKE